MSLRVSDLFCGAGGSTTGAAAVPGVEVRQAFNHWQRAGETHAANHPTVDVAICDLHEVHPAAFERMDVLLGSPECTTHSPASGMRRRGLGQMDAFEACHIAPETLRSRATMWTMTHWASVHRPAAIVVENVVEIHYWPELRAWFDEWRTLGYRWKPVYVNAMHVHGLTDGRVGFNAPQSRDRIYVVLWREGIPAPDLDIRPLAPCASCAADVRAVQSWKPGRTWGRYRRQYVYCCPSCAAVVEPYTYAAAGAIDWTLSAPTIGERAAAGRPLSDKTLARIRYGLDRYGWTPQLVSTRYSSGVECRVRPVTDPLPTQPSQEVTGLVFGNRAGNVPVDAHGEPLPTATTATGGGLALVTALRRNARMDDAQSAVMPTVAAAGSHVALVTMRGTRSVSHVTDALPTVTATAQQIALLSSYYGSHQASDALREPMNAVTTVDRHALVTGTPPVDVDGLGFRMLEPHELLVGTGFPESYKLVGTKRDRVRLVGNSNYPGIEQLLVQRIADALGGAPLTL